MNSMYTKDLEELFDGDRTESLGFVWEIPKPSYYKNKSTLDNKTPLDPDRLRHMERVSFTFSNLKTGTASAPKTAMINHYQVLCKEFVAAAVKSNDKKADTKFQVYYLNVDYSSNDVYIENHNLEMDSVLDDNDWMMLLLIALARDGPGSKSKLSNWEKESKEEKRQQYHQDFLWCCSQNQSRQGSSSGLALPRFKKLLD